MHSATTNNNGKSLSYKNELSNALLVTVIVFYAGDYIFPISTCYYINI